MGHLEEQLGVTPFSYLHGQCIVLRVFTDFGDAFAERNFSTRKGESFLIGFSSTDSKTTNLEKECPPLFPHRCLNLSQDNVTWIFLEGL